MLTVGEMIKVANFEAQYGPSERCFSPDKRGERLTSVDTARTDTKGAITIVLEYEEDPVTGDVRIVQK